MGCVFSQESDRGGRAGRKGQHRRGHQPQQHHQSPGGYQQSPYQNLQQQKSTVNSFAPATPSSANVSGSKSASNSNFATRPSPEKEEDMHFRRQHFDRNSVLRHSKKRTRNKSQQQQNNNGTQEQLPQSQPEVASGTNGIGQECQSTPIRGVTR